MLVTDDGTKKSAKGLIKLIETAKGYEMIDQATWEQEREGSLHEVFRDGKLLIDQNFEQIRRRASAIRY